MALADKIKVRARGGAEGDSVAVPKARVGRVNAKQERFVLLIGDEGAILVYTKGRRVQRRLFAPSPQPEHSKAIVDLMAAHPKVPVRLLVDSIDQQYVRHALPPVSALSISKLVQRRLNRDFPPEDIKGALQIGRDRTGRKEWNYLLISLANTAQIQAWMELIIEQPNQLLGIYLVPVETQNYYNAIASAIPQRSYEGTRATWKLLVTHNKVGGFRQVVLKEGKLSFTRLAQSMDDAIPAVVAGNIEQEILNTMEYLRRLGYTDPATLEIVTVAAQEVKDSLDLKRFNAAGAYAVAPLEVAEFLGLEQAALSADRYGDVVMATHFATVSKPVMKLMSKYGKQIEQFYQIRLAAKIAGSLLVALMALSSVDNIVTYFMDSSESSEIGKKQTQLQAQIAEVQEGLTKVDDGTSVKSAVVAAADVFKVYQYDPLEFIQKLVPLLKDVTVTSFNWERKELPGGIDSTAIMASGVNNPPLVITVDMEFTAPFSDKDQLIRAVKEYVDNLKLQLPEYEIKQEGGATQSSTDKVEVSFDAKSSPVLQDGTNKVRLIFSGPNANTAANPATAPMMGAM
ncbi:MAG: hypothetical protein J0M34_04075 [Alphaproteobacteria bacterium]|nr:hypothetical protein [Alphaproteobacteria bacterium]